jgi:hypothetical protein
MLRKGLFGPSAYAIRCVDSHGTDIGMNHDPPSHESRAEFAVRVANDLKNESGDRFLDAVIKNLQRLWDQGYAHKTGLVSLLNALTQRGLKEEDKVFISANKCLSGKLEELDDFRALAQFVDRYPNAIEQTELDNVKREFTDFASDYSVGWEDDPDWLRVVAADLEFVGTKLAIDVKRFTAPLYKQADQIEIERNEHERDEDDRDDWERGSEPGSYLDDVDEMFASLRADIEG